MKNKQIIQSVIADLTKIRNALIHGSGIAGEDNSVQNCKVLKWFKRGDKLTLTISHVFEFLQHLGLLQGGFTKAKQDSDADQSNLRLMWLTKKDAGLKFIRRKIVSLDDSGITDGKPDERYIHVLFDNGVFGSFYPREFSINSFHSVKVVKGNLKFDNKTLIKASDLYRLLFGRFPVCSHSSLSFGFTFTAEGPDAELKFPKPEEVPLEYCPAEVILIDVDTERSELN